MQEGALTSLHQDSYGSQAAQAQIH